MATRKQERRWAREGALALLYSADMTEIDASEIIEAGAYPDEDIKVSEYAERLVNGVNENLDDIDRHLAATSENWSVDRMPIVDREILRVAVFEMLYVDEVPVSVAINEAVELAKLYGGEDESPRFVNGILGRIARKGEEKLDASDAASDFEGSDTPDAAPVPEPSLASEAESAFEPSSDSESDVLTTEWGSDE